MSHRLVVELGQHLADLAADVRCRVVILTGAGKGFCSGTISASLALPDRVGFGF